MAEPAKLLLVESTESYNVPRAIELSSETTTLGRSSKMCTVVLDATPTKSISRKHAEIVRTKGRPWPDKYILRDLGSTNGVFVNEVKINEQPLEHDDVVQFGGAADIPVGTRFGGTGSHIRYRFDRKLAPPVAAQDSRKRRQSDEPAADAPAAQRAKKPERTNTMSAAEALRTISDGGPSKRTEAIGGLGEAQAVAGSGGVQPAGGSGSRGADAGEAPDLVMEVLGDAMCGLCSELLLDAGVLPCSHSFCMLCWADHVEEKGTTCPVCLRKMHSSESNPRRCSNLDLLVTSIVHKLAGPRERERWKARQEHAQKREAAAAAGKNQASRNGPTAAADARKAGTSTVAAATASGPSPARGVHLAENGGSGTSNGRPKGSERGDQNPRQPRGAPGTASRTDSSRSSGEDGRSGAAVAVAVAAKCEGCNEGGHDFGECPHRSDSALAGSEEEDEEEESDEPDDYQDEEGDEDYQSDDA